MHATSKQHKVMHETSTTNMVTTVKYFPATTKEWCNSVYAYNKDALKLLPVYDNIITKLIRGYFNFYRPKKQSWNCCSRVEPNHKFWWETSGKWIWFDTICYKSSISEPRIDFKRYWK